MQGEVQRARRVEMGAPTLQHGVCGRGARGWGLRPYSTACAVGEPVGSGPCPPAYGRGVGALACSSRDVQRMNLLLTGQGVGGGGCDGNPCANAGMA
jgi:hypothetical protein